MCQVYFKRVIQTWNFKKHNLPFKKDSRNGHSCPFQPYLASPSTYCTSMYFACPGVKDPAPMSYKWPQNGFSQQAWQACAPMHNVHFVKYVFLPTEQAETCLKICVLINYSTYICPSLFSWKENLIFKDTMIFKL